MPQERYPLEAARTLREQELEEARRSLADRTGEVEEAERAVEVARQAVARHREETAGVARRESARDAAGRSAGQMLAARDYLARRGREERELNGRVAEADRALGEARRLLDVARAALADARAAREAVEKHRDRWQGERARVAERRAEAELDDLASAKHRRD